MYCPFNSELVTCLDKCTVPFNNKLYYHDKTVPVDPLIATNSLYYIFIWTVVTKFRSFDNILNNIIENNTMYILNNTSEIIIYLYI